MAEHKRRKTGTSSLNFLRLDVRNDDLFLMLHLCPSITHLPYYAPYNRVNWRIS